MAYERLQAVVGTAIVDPTFCRNLLSKDPDILASFELSLEESEAIRTVCANNLQEFAQELQNWINRRNGSGSAPRRARQPQYQPSTR